MTGHFKCVHSLKLVSISTELVFGLINVFKIHTLIYVMGIPIEMASCTMSNYLSCVRAHTCPHTCTCTVCTHACMLSHTSVHTCTRNHLFTRIQALTNTYTHFIAVAVAVVGPFTIVSIYSLNLQFALFCSWVDVVMDVVTAVDGSWLSLSVCWELFWRDFVKLVSLFLEEDGYK